MTPLSKELVVDLGRAADLIKPEPGMGGPKGRYIGPVSLERAWLTLDTVAPRLEAIEQAVRESTITGMATLLGKTFPGLSQDDVAAAIENVRLGITGSHTHVFGFYHGSEVEACLCGQVLDG